MDMFLLFQSARVFSFHFSTRYTRAKNPYVSYLRMKLRRLKNIISEIVDITLVFDKRNNSKGIPLRKFERKACASPKTKKINKEKLEKHIENILSGPLIKDSIKVKRASECKSGYTINYRIDERQKQRIIDDIFGKKVLFTNRNSWSDREIIEAYHGQSKIEKVFRHLKNPYYIAVRPQFHWTDQKIKAHIFSCLLGVI